MAIANPLQPFLWGSGGEQMTPQQVARQREIADALMGSVGDTSPVRHWLQGVPRLTNALGFSMRENLANEQETRGREAFQDRFNSIFGGGSPVRAADTGSVASLLAEPAVTSAPALDAATGLAASGDMQAYRDAIASIESAGSGDYAAVGPTHPTLGRALGRYQVMEANIGPWSRQVLGREVTPDEFMANPQLQDAIFDGIFGGYVDQYGPEGAAQAWFAGPGSIGAAGAENRRDSLGTTVSSYVDRFANATGGGSGGVAPSSAPVRVAQGPQYNIGELIGLANDPWADEVSRSIAMSLVEQQLTPPAPLEPIEVGGVLLDPVTYEPLFDSRTPEPPGFDTVTLQLPDGTQRSFNTAIPEQAEAANALLSQGAIEASSPLVSIGGEGSPGLGNLSTDYGYVLDPNTGQPVIDPETGLPRAAPVPGSPAALAAAQAAAEEEARAGSQAVSDAQAASNTLSDIRSVRETIQTADTPVTGTLSVPFAQFSGTPAGRVRSYVNTLQSGVALGAMQRLKEASATGATGFGALSAPELNLLINEIGALDPNTTEPDIFLETLQRIETNARFVVEDIKRNVSPERIQELGLQPFIDAFEEEGDNGANTPQQSQSNPEVVDWQTYFNQ